MRMSLLFSFVVVSVVAASAQAPSPHLTSRHRGHHRVQAAKPPQGTHPAQSCAGTCATAPSPGGDSLRNGHHRHRPERRHPVRHQRHRVGRHVAKRGDGWQRQSESDGAHGRNVSTEIRRREGDLVRARGDLARRTGARRRRIAEPCAGAAARARTAAATRSGAGRRRRARGTEGSATDHRDPRLAGQGVRRSRGTPGNDPRVQRQRAHDDDPAQ